MCSLRRDLQAVLVLAVLLALATIEAAHAQVVPSVPTRAADVAPVVSPEQAPLAAPDQAARSVLQKHCARCHERAQRAPDQPGNAFQNVLDLQALQQSAGLIQPGRPDASPLYTLLLRGHSPQDVWPHNETGPSPDEIASVRAWIEKLEPQPVAACGARRMVTLADIGTALQRLRGPGGEALKGIRFISLSAYHNACASPEQMETLRKAAGELVTALRTTLVDFDLPLAADNVPVLAVRLGDMGWHTSQWDALAAIARAPHLTDHALAEAYGTETPAIDIRALAAAAVQSGQYPKVLEMAGAAQQFVADGRAPIDVASAAGDLGLPPAVLLPRLEAVAGPTEPVARRLRQGLISRPAWRELRAGLATPGDDGILKYRPDAPGGAAPGDTPLDVGLWTDKTAYRAGDVVVLTAQANRDCNLTLVNVDPRGDATILFPSDSDPDNAIKAGAKIRVPGEIEPYLLRASEPGVETFIAVCSVNRKRMLGVDQDFEKQRFTMLGNWGTFLTTAHTRETLVGRRDTPRQRRARAKANAAAAAAAAAQPDEEARAAIYVKIE